MFSFSMPLLVEVGVSVAAYSELLDESKSIFFSKFAGLIILLRFGETEINFSITYCLNQRSSTFFTQSPLFGKFGSKLPPQSIDEQNIKKDLHVHRHTIFPLKIDEEEKKICMRPAICSARTLRIFFRIFIKFPYLRHICKSF